jgi:CRISPR/Cas system Type II protein with McrA/HNH and RuvC-like nuclease domain
MVDSIIINRNRIIQINVDKLELATPKREDLKKIHVDHFIPWSFVKEDKMWNFVLSFPESNERKNNEIP